MYYVYILQSLKNHRYYTGSTENLDRRIQEHNTGQSKYTRLTRPFELVHSEAYSLKANALKRERYLKTGKGRQELQQLFISK